MDFGEAIRQLKEGRRVARAGWNGKGMWLVLCRAFLRPDDPKSVELSLDNSTPWDACIVLRTARGSMQPGWTAAQPDMLSDDWFVLDA